jgi:hypothetical protein
MKSTGRTTKVLAGGALVLAGFGAGAVVAVTGSASAATDTVVSGVSAAAQKLDPTKSVRSDEHLLSGATATKVRAAALAAYPGATIQRVETDSDGVYEAHIVTKAGAQVFVSVGKDFAVTGTDTGGPRRGPGAGPGARRPRAPRLTPARTDRPPSGSDGAAAVPGGRGRSRHDDGVLAVGLA